jgi:hypothetical protein
MSEVPASFPPHERALSVSKLTQALQISYPWLFKSVRKKCGARKNPSLEERDRVILTQAALGVRYETIAKSVGLSTIRVRQILRMRGGYCVHPGNGFSLPTRPSTL